jgi:thiamine pyrophosphokinase
MLRKWAESADILIAADGGADNLLSVGCTPTVIVGDMDSLSPPAMVCGAELYKITDQNYTDCDKLLRFVQDRDLLPLTLAGIEGDRIDHVLSSLHSVAASPIRDKVRLAFRRSLGWVLGPGHHSQSSFPGAVTSLIPLTACENVRSAGLRWEIEGRELEIGKFISVSNQCLGTELSISLSAGSLLLTIEHRAEEYPIW